MVGKRNFFWSESTRNWIELDNEKKRLEKEKGTRFLLCMLWRGKGKKELERTESFVWLIDWSREIEKRELRRDDGYKDLSDLRKWFWRELGKEKIVTGFEVSELKREGRVDHLLSAIQREGSIERRRREKDAVPASQYEHDTHSIDEIGNAGESWWWRDTHDRKRSRTEKKR